MACRDDVRCWACRTIMHLVFSVGDLSESRRQGPEAILLASLSHDHVFSSRIHIELMANCVRFNLTAAFSTVGAQSCTCLRAIIKIVFLATSPVIPSDPFTPTHRHESFVFISPQAQLPLRHRLGTPFSLHGVALPFLEYWAPFLSIPLDSRLPTKRARPSTLLHPPFKSLVFFLFFCFFGIRSLFSTVLDNKRSRCYEEHYIGGPGRI